MFQRVCVLVPVLFVFAVAGCGEKGPPPGAPLATPSPVHGKVTLASGTMLKGGVINFYPVENEVEGKLRFQGGALVDAKGEYTAGRNGDNKGLAPGEYVVTVAPREVGELPGSNSKSIPKAYQEKSTSKLKITVSAGENAINLDLK